MVSRRAGEFLYLSAVGGIDVRNLPGQRVTVHGRRDLPGVIALPPAHLLPEGAGKAIELEYLVLDTGLPEAELAGLVRTGDLVSYAQPPLELNGDLLVGHSLDNRVSVAAVTHALELLRGRSLEWDIWAAATVQEEVGLIGAGTSAFQLRPSLAIAVDTTWGSGPGSPGHKTFAVGKGITLGWGPSVHPGAFKAVKAVADRLELPYTLEAMPTSSGTDADRMQLAAEGLPTMVVSIPLRYMHSPVEMAALKDIARAGRLLAEFAAGLDGGFMERLSLDE
jgi:endoglucanase